MTRIILATITLLTISNVFMTFAWYGHLKFKSSPMWLVIIVSWLIALFEYCFQVPANRLGHTVMSAAQLKILQEFITILVFSVFSYYYLGERLQWNHWLAFGLMFLGVVVFNAFPKVSEKPHEALPVVTGQNTST